MKQSLYLLLPLLLATSCAKNVDSADLKDEVPYYQYYEVGYNKTDNSTIAAAMFYVRDKSGAKVELTNGASVRANGLAPGTSSVDKTRYTWTMTGMPGVDFTLTKNSGSAITNSISRNDIGDVAFATGFPANIKKTEGFVFNWTGDALKANEKLTVSITSYAGVDIITKSVSSNPVSITAEELKNCPEGEITIGLYRAKEMAVKTEDAGAGGVIQLRLSVTKTATLQ